MSPLKTILACIALGLGIFGLFITYYRQEQLENPTYHLTTLAFTQTGYELISKGFFEEVLDLSVENPVNLVHFSLPDAKKKLLSYPFIEDVTLEKIVPDTLFIHCVLRKPLFELADYKQVAIDKEGVLFPMQFFYTPKKLPKVYLGLGSSPLQFANCLLKLDHEELKLILTLLKKIPGIKLIDLSRINSESLGRREIIVTLSEDRFVRLPFNDWEKALTYLPKIPPSYKEVDLRFAKRALVK